MPGCPILPLARIGRIIGRHWHPDAAFIGNGQAGLQQIIDSHEELRANKDKLVVLPVPLARDPLHLAFAKAMGKADAIARFDAALDTIWKSGELKKIAEEASR